MAEFVMKIVPLCNFESIKQLSLIITPDSRLFFEFKIRSIQNIDNMYVYYYLSK